MLRWSSNASAHPDFSCLLNSDNANRPVLPHSWPSANWSLPNVDGSSLTTTFLACRMRSKTSHSSFAREALFLTSTMPFFPSTKLSSTPSISVLSLKGCSLSLLYWKPNKSRRVKADVMVLASCIAWLSTTKSSKNADHIKPMNLPIACRKALTLRKWCTLAVAPNGSTFMMKQSTLLLGGFHRVTTASLWFSSCKGNCLYADFKSMQDALKFGSTPFHAWCTSPVKCSPDSRVKSSRPSKRRNFRMVKRDHSVWSIVLNSNFSVLANVWFTWFSLKSSMGRSFSRCSTAKRLTGNHSLPSLVSISSGENGPSSQFLFSVSSTVVSYSCCCSSFPSPSLALPSIIGFKNFVLSLSCWGDIWAKVTPGLKTPDSDTGPTILKPSVNSSKSPMSGQLMSIAMDRMRRMRLGAMIFATSASMSSFNCSSKTFKAFARLAHSDKILMRLRVTMSGAWLKCWKRTRIKSPGKFFSSSYGYMDAITVVQHV